MELNDNGSISKVLPTLRLGALSNKEMMILIPL